MARARSSPWHARVAFFSVFLVACFWAAFSAFRSNRTQSLIVLTADAQNQDYFEHDSGIGFTPNQIDLGTHFWNSKIPIDLEFLNNSNRPIEISATHSPCSCTTPYADYVGRVVSAKSLLPVQLVLDVGRDLGSLNRKFAIVDTDGHSYWAEIRVNVTPTWSIGRNFVDFGDVIANKPIKHCQSIPIQLNRNCLIRKAISTSRWVDVELAYGPKDGIALLLHLVPGNLAPGKNIASVQIVTDDDRVAEQTLLISADSIDELIPDITRIFLKRGDSQTVSFKVRETGDAVSIRDVTSDSEEVIADVIDERYIRIHSTFGSGDDELEHLIVVRDANGRMGRLLVSAINY